MNKVEMIKGLSFRAYNITEPKTKSNTDTNSQKLEQDLIRNAALGKSQINFKGKLFNINKKDLLFLSSLTASFGLSAEYLDKLKQTLSEFLSDNDFKKISPRKEIKPKTFQVKKGQSIIVCDILRVDYIEGERNSLTFYMSNDLKIRRISNRHNDLKDLQKRSYEIGFNKDICINGLGFIKIVNKGSLDIYLDSKVSTYIRDNLI